MSKPRPAPGTVPANDLGARDRRSAAGPDTRSEAGLPVLTRAKGFGIFLIVAGVVAWVASAALVLDRIKLYINPNASVSCDINTWISCGSVMKTDQAELFGFPNPFLGLVAFAVVITTGTVLLAGARMARWYWLGLQVGVTLGFVLICWFWFQALYVLATLCPYCMVVWSMMIPLFVWVTVRNLHHGVIRAPAGLVRFLAEWAWVLVGLLYIVVLASIFFRFMHLFLGGGAG